MTALKKGKISKNRFFRIGLVLSTVVILITGIILLFWLITRALFSKNSHFTLKYVEVQSAGWWNNRSRKVESIIGLKPGKENLFALDLKEIRKALETQPSIEKVTVVRILPDTLKINVTERIPRAYLDSKDSLWVVDSTGTVMSRDSCMNLGPRLPIIVGYEKGKSKVLRAGMELPQLKPILSLIMLTITEFTDFRIAAISLKEHGEIKFVMYYKGRTHNPYKVIMPPVNIRKNLQVLKSAIIRALKKGDPRRTLNLMYKNNVVMSMK